MVTLFYTAKVITDLVMDDPRKSYNFGQKNWKPASVVTLFNTDKVIADPVMKTFHVHEKKIPCRFLTCCVQAYIIFHKKIVGSTHLFKINDKLYTNIQKCKNQNYHFN